MYRSSTGLIKSYVHRLTQDDVVYIGIELISDLLFKAWNHKSEIDRRNF